MNNVKKKSTLASDRGCLFFYIWNTSTIHAEESGTGHYLPGGSATMIDTAPT